MPFQRPTTSPFFVATWRCDWRSVPIRGAVTGGDCIAFESNRRDQTELVLLLDICGNGNEASVFLEQFLERILADEGAINNSPTELFIFLDGMLSQPWLLSPGGERFVAALAVRFDPANATFTAISAGSPNPLITASGGSARIWDLSIGRYLGIPIPGTSWTDATYTPAPTESLVVFSDGVTDAHPPNEPVIGYLPLINLWPRTSPSDAFLDQAWNWLSRISPAEWPQSDTTLLTLRQASQL